MPPKVGKNSSQVQPAEGDINSSLARQCEYALVVFDTFQQEISSLPSQLGQPLLARLVEQRIEYLRLVHARLPEELKSQFADEYNLTSPNR